jgi:hypothetical protein
MQSFYYKYITTLILLSLLILSCSDNETEVIYSRDGTITGNWKVIQVFVPDIPAGAWGDITDNITYTFNADLTFSTNLYQECTTGTYSMANEELILDFDCPDFTAGIESPPGVFKEAIRFENGFLYFRPTYLLCIEGCFEYRLERLVNE